MSDASLSQGRYLSPIVGAAVAAERQGVDVVAFQLAAEAETVIAFRDKSNFLHLDLVSVPESVVLEEPDAQDPGEVAAVVHGHVDL